MTSEVALDEGFDNEREEGDASVGDLDEEVLKQALANDVQPLLRDLVDTMSGRCTEFAAHIREDYELRVQRLSRSAEEKVEAFKEEAARARQQRDEYEQLAQQAHERLKTGTYRMVEVLHTRESCLLLRSTFAAWKTWLESTKDAHCWRLGIGTELASRRTVRSTFERWARASLCRQLHRERGTYSERVSNVASHVANRYETELERLRGCVSGLEAELVAERRRRHELGEVLQRGQLTNLTAISVLGNAFKGRADV